MASKTVFQADRDGWYVGPVEAQESPLEKGVFLIPAGCYEEAPGNWPPYPPGKWIRRVENAWVMLDDPDAAPAPAPQEPPPDPVTPAQIQALRIVQVQEHLDAQAQALGYDSIYTAVTYAEEPAVPKFQNEGRALRAWRSLVWAACHAILAEVLAGTRDIPTRAELIAALPPFEAP